MTTKHQNGLCRFCLLLNEDILRIAWNEWQDSSLAGMYETVMKQKLPYLKNSLEVCYCKKCAELLCQTVYALQMFQRSDTYWRNLMADAPVSSRANDHLDIVAEYLEDDDIAEISALNASKMDSFELESVKIELVDSDYGNTMDFTHLDENNPETNKYKDFWKMIYEEDPVYIDPKIKPVERTSNDSLNDKNTTKAIHIAENKRKRSDSPKILKQVKPPKIIRDDKLPCVLCDEIFPNRTTLNWHTEKTHNMVQCIQCQFTSSTRNALRRHEINEHKRSMDTISPCPKCGKIFADAQKLRTHDKHTHAPLVALQCDICSLMFTSALRLKNHMNNVHVEPIFECDICKRKFRQRKNLKLHIMTVHVKKSQFICAACGRKFTNSSTWKKHESRQCRMPREERNYNPNPIFSCSVCNAKLVDLTYGRLHYQKVHRITDVRNVCFICNYLCSTPDELNDHLNADHSGLRCSVCKRFFKSQITLKSHIATHSSKERPYECTICKAKFVRSIHVRDHHIRFHSTERPYKCTDCDLRFVTNCEMIAHWRHKHDCGDRKLKCNWCEKRFVTKTELRLHEAIHTGIGKYNCDICGQNFRLNYGLVKHFQRFHPYHEIR